MPYIQCEVQAGMSAEQKSRLAKELRRVTNEALGAPDPYIYVVVREAPATQFVEAGEVNTSYGAPVRGAA